MNPDHWTIKRAYAINSPMPPGWKNRVGRSLFDPNNSKHNKQLLPVHQVTSVKLVQAANQLVGGMRQAGAQNPEILGVLDQAGLVGAAFTAHPTDLASHYDRITSDKVALTTIIDGKPVEMGLEDLRTLQHGPFPFTALAGNDWLQTGRTYHRVLQVVNFRSEYHRPDVWEAIAESIRFPAILSVVSQSQPGRFQEFKLEEIARAWEVIRSALDRGYETESKKSRERIEGAERARDDTFESGAPSLETNVFAIVSSTDLDTLTLLESWIRQIFETQRIDLEVVQGKENQLPFFLYALGIERL